MHSPPPPMKHQVEAADALEKWEGRGAVLADPGLGKTKITLDYLGREADLVGPRVWAVIAPLDILGVWRGQVAEHLPDAEFITATGSTKDKLELVRATAPPSGGARGTRGTVSRVRMLGINYDALSQTGGKLHLKLRDALAAYDGVVLDEMHFGKGRSSTRGRTVRGLAARIEKVIGLTGTFIPNDWQDIWGQWLCIEPDSLPSSFAAYAQRYGNHETIWNPHRGKTVEIPTTCKDWPALQRIVARRSVSYRKEDCLDLPPLVEQPIPVALDPPTRRLYDRLLDEKAMETPSGVVIPEGILARITTLRQLTSGFYTAGGRTYDVGREKLRTLATLLEGEKGKVVVFTHWLHDVARAADVMTTLGRTTRTITGAVTGGERLRRREWFRDTDDSTATLVCQIGVVAHGINELAAAQRAIFVSESTNWAEMIQARDRLHRYGQEGSKVLIQYLVAADTIDGEIRDAHNGRQAVEDRLRAYVGRAG